MFQTLEPTHTLSHTRAHTPAEVTLSDPLLTLVIASVVSREGRGGRDRDRSQKHVRTAEERGERKKVGRAKDEGTHEQTERGRDR